MFSDEKIFHEFKKKNQAILTSVYRNYSPKLAAFLYKGFNFKSNGRDYFFSGYKRNCDLMNAVLNTFEKAFSDNAIANYDGVRSYENYLFTIARNMTIDELRKKTIEFSDVPDPDNIYICQTDTENIVLTDELKTLLKKFINNLDPLEKEVLSYRFENGLSQEDCAGALNLTRRKIRTIEKNIRIKALDFFKCNGYLPENFGSGVNILILLVFLININNRG